MSKFKADGGSDDYITDHTDTFAGIAYGIIKFAKDSNNRVRGSRIPDYFWMSINEGVKYIDRSGWTEGIDDKKRDGVTKISLSTEVNHLNNGRQKYGSRST